MTRQGGLHTTYYTRCHSIGTYDIVQENVSSRASFIIVVIFKQAKGGHKMMSVVGKSNCSGFKTGLHISYHGQNAVRYIKQRHYFMKGSRICDYFDTKSHCPALYQRLY